MKFLIILNGLLSFILLISLFLVDKWRNLGLIPRSIIYPEPYETFCKIMGFIVMLVFSFSIVHGIQCVLEICQG